MRVCMDCGEPLPKGCRSNKLRCAACQRVRHNAMTRELHRAEYRKEIMPAERKPTAALSLSDVARSAREAGLSYGKYVSKIGART